MMGSLINLRNPGGGPINTGLITWKLYDNPHYSGCCNDVPQHHQYSYNCLPPLVQLSTTKLQSPLVCFPMDHCDSELVLARAQIKELRAELEFERRMRYKAESLNNVLARDLTNEQQGREAADGLCKRLKEEIASMRKEMDRAVKEIEEEKKMLRIAEVWREERVQMKLTEARLLMEERPRETAASPCRLEMAKRAEEGGAPYKVAAPPLPGDSSTENSKASIMVGLPDQTCQPSQQRREAENPHIKRGIKGFVEFPRSVRVQSSSREGRMHLESNLECQRAQLRVLLRHRNSVGIGSLETSEFGHVTIT